MKCDGLVVASGAVSLAVSLLTGCAAKVSIPTCMEPVLTGKSSTFGPLANAEDQFRFMSCTDYGFAWGVPPFYGNMLDIGLNGHVLLFRASESYDVRMERPFPYSEHDAAGFKAYLDQCLKDGVAVMPRNEFPHSAWLRKMYPRINKDGSHDERNADISNPEPLGRVLRGIACIAERCRHPAVIGIQNQSEIRDRSHPSFTPEMRAAYRMYSGHDIPAAVTNSPTVECRNPPHWRTLKDFPKDRVVDDDYPLLDFYVWTWQKGDGWVKCMDESTRVFEKALGRPIFAHFSPSLRTPPLDGVNGDISVLGHWTYPYPEPYSVSYDISSQQSRARKAGNGIFQIVQAISYRSHIAPLGEHPQDEPSWTTEFPNTRYPTTPPDLLREAIWSVFARKVDGIGFHGWQSLWDAMTRIKTATHYVHTSDFYQCTNPEAATAIKETMDEAGIPLGPLFRAIPERAPKVAIVESYASLFLGSRVMSNCCGDFFHYGTAAIAANLMPATLTESEIRENGVPGSVKVLIMPECDVLTRKCYAKLVAFKARGGRILADGILCPAIKADGKLTEMVSPFPRTSSDHDEGKSSDPSIAGRRERAIRAAADCMRAFASQDAAPYADSENRDLHLWTRSNGRADYVFVVNDKRTYGDYCGPWRRVKEKGLPNEGTFFVNRTSGAVYNLVRHAAVPFRVENGKTLVDVRFKTSDGKVFLCVDRPLGMLTVSVKDGRLAVLSPDKGVLVPIRIDGLGEKPFYAVVRSGAFVKSVGMPDCSRIQVTNLADGQVAKVR